MKIFIFILLFFNTVAKAQLTSIVVRNDTIFNVDPSTGTWTQLTKLVSLNGNNGKILSTNGSIYSWIDTANILQAYRTAIIAQAASILLKYNISDTATGFTNYRNSIIANAVNILLKFNLSDTASAFNNYRLAIIATANAALATLTNKTISGASNTFSNIPITAITNYTGYTLSVQALTSGPTDAQTIYFGNQPKAPTANAAQSKVYIRKAGTIKIAEIYSFATTAGSNEAWPISIRLNNTTDTQIASISVSAGERIWSNTGLSIAVIAGDYIEIKSVNPTWATNPLAWIVGGYLYIE